MIQPSDKLKRLLKVHHYPPEGAWFYDGKQPNIHVPLSSLRGLYHRFDGIDYIKETTLPKLKRLYTFFELERLVYTYLHMPSEETYLMFKNGKSAMLYFDKENFGQDSFLNMEVDK